MVYQAEHLLRLGRIKVDVVSDLIAPPLGVSGGYRGVESPDDINYRTYEAFEKNEEN